jgi:hypothetical protein
MLLTLLETLRTTGIQPEHNLLLIASVGEEGLEISEVLNISLERMALKLTNGFQLTEALWQGLIIKDWVLIDIEFILTVLEDIHGGLLVLPILITP